MKTKSQAALEFLVTYSWAFLTIMITVAVLYYFGIFDFSKYLPEKCIFTNQLNCLDSVIRDDAGGNDISIKLLNNLGEDITIESMSITNEVDPPLSCDPPPPNFIFSSDTESDFVFSDCEDGGFIVGERIEAKITLTYYSPLTNPGSEPRHVVKGLLIKRIQ